MDSITTISGCPRWLEFADGCWLTEAGLFKLCVMSTDVRFWRVNQKLTYRHEVAVGYLWSPKRNANDARNHFYETMREVSPGR
jgi:hypothetical protein